MIANDEQLQTTLERLDWFQKQVGQLRNTETSLLNYRSAVSGFLEEINRMQLEVREYSTLASSGARGSCLTNKRVSELARPGSSGEHNEIHRPH